MRILQYNIIHNFSTINFCCETIYFPWLHVLNNMNEMRTWGPPNHNVIRLWPVFQNKADVTELRALEHRITYSGIVFKHSFEEHLTN